MFCFHFFRFTSMSTVLKIDPALLARPVPADHVQFMPFRHAPQHIFHKISSDFAKKNFS